MIRIAAPAREHLAPLVASVVMLVIRPLVGIAWANLSMLAYLVFPGSFNANPEIAWQPGERHQRRALFDCPSFTTMMALGRGDITPIGSPAYSLTGIEAMFGRF